MGDKVQAWRWKRYQRGLRTIPVILLLSLGVWVMTGGGYFWPKWVILWAIVAMGFRATRAMRNGPPEDEPIEELSPSTMRPMWPPSRSALGYARATEPSIAPREL